MPLLGGSGGAGQPFGPGDIPQGPGGGAGGGALLIASSVSIVVNGSVLANGGAGGGIPGNSPFIVGGGCGAGGAIHLLAPTIGGTGLLSASGSCTRPNTTLQPGGQGRIRLEAFQRTFTGSIDPVPLFVSPYAVVLPPTPPPSVRVVSVAGILVTSTPTGSFTMPDVTLNTVAAVPVVIEARYVPPKTIVKLFLASENGADQTVDSDPLAGELALSTATASVVPPPGFSWGYVRAIWTP